MARARRAGAILERQGIWPREARRGENEILYQTNVRREMHLDVVADPPTWLGHLWWGSVVDYVGTSWRHGGVDGRGSPDDRLDAVAAKDRLQKRDVWQGALARGVAREPHPTEITVRQ